MTVGLASGTPLTASVTLSALFSITCPGATDPNILLP